MKLTSIQYDKYVPLSIPGAFIRNVPMAEYKKHLDSIHKMSIGIDKTDVSDQDAHDMNDAVNDFFAALICDEEGEGPEEYDVVNALPISVVRTLIDDAIKHITGPTGN